MGFLQVLYKKYCFEVIFLLLTLYYVSPIYCQAPPHYQELDNHIAKVWISIFENDANCVVTIKKQTLHHIHNLHVQATYNENVLLFWSVISSVPFTYI
jgi:uncharacterized protein (DUF1499 family)